MNSQNCNCLKENSSKYENYALVPIRMQDADLIRKWRNEQIEFLRQEKTISNEEQKSYFKKVIKHSFDQTEPELILFSFLEKSKLIGYGGFVNIDWENKISEISFLIETKRSKNELVYEKDFSIFLSFLKKIACNELKFNGLFAETYNIRPNHIRILEKNRFKKSKRKNNVKIIEGKLVDVLFHYYVCGKDENI